MILVKAKRECWIQQKRGFGDWFDYCQKKNIREISRRLVELNKGREQPEFRGLLRVVSEQIQR